MIRTTLLAFSLLLIPAALRCQVGMEPASTAAPESLYPAEWPDGPGPDSVPAWAKPGAISFARWDGGPIETSKAFLSGWPGFNPPIPERVYSMTNWYDPRTISLLREAGIRMIWVTFSNGFSNQTEEVQREQLRPYIDECHRQGIRVMAYESIANMFWEDMFEHVPESKDWLNLGKDGKPVPYGAAAYEKMGRTTRYMANLGNPGWRAYLRKRVDLAIDAGADGVIYDNNFSNYLFPVYRDIYQYASRRKKDFLLMGNFHANTYVFNRLLNCITTEDGVEPGIYRGMTENRRVKRQRESLLKVGDGVMVNNIGLFRIHSALSEGWKPVMVEDGGREIGVRETTPMAADRHRLALAEGMMYNVAMELFVEGGFANGLWNKDAETMNIWRAIGQYNRFFADNEDYYVGARSVAPLAIVLDDRGDGVELLNGLGARNVLYDVLYEHGLTREKLRPYAAVAVLTSETAGGKALAALEEYVAGGGTLIAASKAASLDEKGQKRPRPAFFGRKTGKGECIYREQLPEIEELAALLSNAAKGPVKVEAPEGVVYNLTEQPERNRRIIHLLNYTLQPVRRIKLTVEGKLGAVRLLSPDAAREPVRVLRSSDASAELEVPALTVYSLLVLENPAGH